MRPLSSANVTDKAPKGRKPTITEIVIHVCHYILNRAAEAVIAANSTAGSSHSRLVGRLEKFHDLAVREALLPRPNIVVVCSDSGDGLGGTRVVLFKAGRIDHVRHEIDALLRVLKYSPNCIRFRWWESPWYPCTLNTEEGSIQPAAAIKPASNRTKWLRQSGGHRNCVCPRGSR